MELSAKHKISERINRLYGQIKAHENMLIRTVNYGEIPQIVGEIRNKQKEIDALYLNMGKI